LWLFDLKYGRVITDGSYVEHLGTVLKEDKAKNRLAFYEHLEQLDRLIELVALFLIFTSTALLLAIYGYQVAACIGFAQLLAMIGWRKRRVRIEQLRRTSIKEAEAQGAIHA
jgi:hypothetical protein